MCILLRLNVNLNSKNIVGDTVIKITNLRYHNTLNLSLVTRFIL